MCFSFIMHFQHALSPLAHYRLPASCHLELTSSFPLTCQLCRNLWIGQLTRYYLMIQREEIADPSTHLFTSTRRSHVQRQIRLYRKATKECLLQWEAPLYKSQFPAFLRRQDTGAWSRYQGGQESPSYEKSLKRNKRDTASEKVESPCWWLRVTSVSSENLKGVRKRGEEGMLSSENKHNEDSTRKPKRQCGWFHRWFSG